MNVSLLSCSCDLTGSFLVDAVDAKSITGNGPFFWLSTVMTAGLGGAEEEEEEEVG